MTVRIAPQLGSFFLLWPLAVCLTVPASAQFGGTGALGGPYLSRGVSRPLGGIQEDPPPGTPARRVLVPPPSSRRGPGYVTPYAYAVYVPNYFNTAVDPSYAPVVYAPQPTPVQAPAQPVIINQYFMQGEAPAGTPVRSAPNQPAPAPPAAEAATPGDPIGPVENYYLIAYANRSVYAALAYWVEGNTLHYVTTQNTHNQAALDLIDLELTKNLNRTRNVPFSLPGK